MKRIMFNISLWLLFFACTQEDDKGRIIIRLTDSPGDYEEVNVDIQDIQILKNNEGSNTWHSLPNVNKGIYNLLDLTNGRETVLTNAEYPTGRINQIRLVLGENNSVVINGIAHPLKTPSGQQSGLKLLLNTELTKGITYAILLDFDAARSVVKTGNEKYVLKPVIKVVSEALDGGIAGTVIPAHLNIAAFAISGLDTISTSYVSAGATDFYLGGLPAGNYTVSFDAGDSSAYANKIIENVVVTTGKITELESIELELK